MTYVREWREWLRQNRAGLGSAVLVCAVATLAILLAYHRAWAPRSLPAQAREVVATLVRSGWYLLLPLLSLPLLKLRLSEAGIALGRPKRWLTDIAVLYVLMLPLLLWASTRPEFQRAYPYFKFARAGGPQFFAGLGLLAVYMLGWEFLFRGYLLFGLARRLGPAAVAVQMVPFALMHMGKPELEAYGSVVAGLVLGLVCLRGGSFLPALILHYAVAATLDMLALLR